MAAPAIVQNTDVVNDAAKTIRAIHTPCAADASLIATSDGNTALIPARLGYTIYVTHISLAVTTDAAGTLTFKDTASTPVVLAATKANPGIGPTLYDFGELGTPLTEDKGLDLTISAAGLAGRVHIEGYYRLTKVGAPLP